jgi:DNA-directed RNA polymerase subunit F
MTEEERFIDFATVREMLQDAQTRRGDLTYEQVAALQHAEWASSDNRNGYKTVPEVFQALKESLSNHAKLSQYPDLAAKIAELMPMYPDDIKAVLVSKRIAIDDNDINEILDIVRQHVGVE